MRRPSGEGSAGGSGTLVTGLLQGIAGYLRRYHRHSVRLDAALPQEPSLIVGNHGVGGVFDLNVLALARTLHEQGVFERTTFLVHDIAWTLRVGPLLERLGCVPGGPGAVSEAFGAGRHVVVFPGGDVEAARPFGERDRVVFDGRTGFARVALEHAVPVVPVVTAGAGESVLVLSDGRRLARALGLPRSLRLQTLPVSVSLPWGINVGALTLLPYLPLPSKLVTAVMPAMRPDEGESAEDFAERVRRRMQDRLDELVSGRRPLLG